ncbi:hypothetical protein ACQY0O_000757 [Thecaphora frezii]
MSTTSTKIQVRRPTEAVGASRGLKSYSAAGGNIAPAPKREKGIYTSTSHAARRASDDDADSQFVDNNDDDDDDGDACQDDGGRLSALGPPRSRSGSTEMHTSKSKVAILTRIFGSPSKSRSRSKSLSKSKARGKQSHGPSAEGKPRPRPIERGPATGHTAEDSEEEYPPSEEERRTSLEQMRHLKEKQRRNVQSMDEAQVAGLQKAMEESERLGEQLSHHKSRGRAAIVAGERPGERLGERRTRSLSPGAKRGPSLLPNLLPNVPLPSVQLPNALTQKLALPHFQIPVKDFPLQGNGKDSEFDQACPVWARQPYKYLYFAYFGLSVGFYYLPAWSLASTFKSKRGRKDWSWKRAMMVKLFRHGTKLTFRTHTNLGRDLTKEVPHSKTVKSKFMWVDKLDDADIRGELSRAMSIQGIKAVRTCGFWYGESGDGGVGQRAAPGEKVMYHLHGGAYWIGTAHESDVTAAVNTQALRYMHEIYESRKYADMSPASSSCSAASEKSRDSGDDGGRSRSSSPSTPASDPKAGKKGSKASTKDDSDPVAKSGKLLRAFSLDYRLCVPGKPQAGSYPAALLDALAGYRYLIDTCGFHPDDVIVAGDSAGGNLAIALCRYLRDEKVMPMPGSLLLMSPWADCSRSHSGPTGAPNTMSTAYRNIKSDIISPCMAFRNTAVSAFLGELPARETYRNPYLSSISLQLPPHRGGKGPFWGFEGFPKRVYITTGSAEISYDQHLTLAHRLAAGTMAGRPIYTGDKLSEGEDPAKLAGRYDYPRPRGLKISLSSATTPGSTPGSEASSGGRLGREQEKERKAASKVLANNDKDSDGLPEASIEELNLSAGEIVSQSRSGEDADRAPSRSADPSQADAATVKVDEVMLPSRRQQQIEEKALKQELRAAQASSAIGREPEPEQPVDGDVAADRQATDVALARDEDRQAKEVAKVRRGPEGYALGASAGRMKGKAVEKRRAASGAPSSRGDEADEVITAQDFAGETETEQPGPHDGDGPSSEDEGSKVAADAKDAGQRRDGEACSPMMPQIRISPPETEAGETSISRGDASYFDYPKPRRRAYSEDSPLCLSGAGTDGLGNRSEAGTPLCENESTFGSKWSLATTQTGLYGGDGAQPHHELEDRVVVLDEVKDAIHDYLLFSWFEPERSSTWRRIARWIDDA